MLNTDLHARLASLQPESTVRLAQLCELAEHQTDRELLAQCRDYLQALFKGETWQAIRPVDAREQAFLAFTEQFAIAVSGVEDAQVQALLAHASADEVYNFVNALYVIDMTARLEMVTARVLP